MGHDLNELGNWKACTKEAASVYYVIDFKEEELNPVGQNVLGICLERATYPTTEVVKATIKGLFQY